MYRLSTTHFLVLFSLLAAPVFTSAQEVTPTEVGAEALKAGDKPAFELLETIAEGIPSLRASDNRIYLANAVADLLWSKDEKRARALFDAVTKELVSAMADFDPSDQERSNELGMLQQQRRETIERMVRHDPEMAMAFLKATRMPLSSGSAQQRADEVELELHLASLIAAKDPAQALRLARASLQKGMPYSVVQLLCQIDSTDRNSAHSLYGEIVDQLKHTDLSRNDQVVNTAWNLLTAYQPPEAKEETYRELMDLLVGSALSVAPRDGGISFAQNYYGQIRSAMPRIEMYAPGRVSAVRQWLQRVQRTQDPGTRIYQEFNELGEKGTVDDILALANKYGPEFQAMIYQQAVGKAVSSGDPNRARQIIADLVADPAQRRQMLEQLENQLAWNTVQEHKITEARRMVSRVKSFSQQVNLLLSLAMNVASTGDKKQALDLLADVRTLLDTSPQNADKLTLQLQLAQNYTSLDSKQSVTLLGSVIGQVNQLVAAAVVLDGFEGRFLKEGEWLKTNYTNLGNMVNTLAQSLGQLARYDPAGARYLSSQLDRLEIRLMAQLEIAQSLLADVSSTHYHMNPRFAEVQ